MILIALGANLPSRHGPPEKTLEAAKTALDKAGLSILSSSRSWRSAPVPVSSDPWYCNAVVSVETLLPPLQVLQRLQRIEKEFGRKTGARNAPRALDLDLIAYHEEVVDKTSLQVPHPRAHQRGFVLVPIKELAPSWIHPSLGLTIDEMIADLPSDQLLYPVKKEAA